jgi:uncharacterized protein (DUF1919 family)
MNLIESSRFWIVKKLRTVFTKSKRIGLDRDISIIANDCLGGMISHDLGLKFLSPTINLYFETPEDYLEFLSDIRYYSSTTIKQVYRDGRQYPIGELRKGDKTVTIHFMHYTSFNEAVAKWQERSKRIHYDNLVVIWHVPFGLTDANFERFKRFHFKKALIITIIDCPVDSKLLCKLDIYGDDYDPAIFFSYKSSSSIFRYIDETRYWKLLKK